MKFKIEKGVPKPRNGGVGRGYPWWEMEVGDSVFFADRDTTTMNTLRWRAQKRHNIVLSSRKLQGGIRIWRDA